MQPLHTWEIKPGSDSLPNRAGFNLKSSAISQTVAEKVFSSLKVALDGRYSHEQPWDQVPVHHMYPRANINANRGRKWSNNQQHLYFMDYEVYVKALDISRIRVVQPGYSDPHNPPCITPQMQQINKALLKGSKRFHTRKVSLI